MQKTNVQIPIPTATESVERYTVRAHTALLKSVPDSDERNRLVWDTWKKHRGQTDVEQVAAKTFDPQRYAIEPGVCVFAEHETVGRDGKPRKYGVKDLAAIARTNNHLAAERSMFSTLADRHTEYDRNAPKPGVLGYCGNYRLGMVGRNQPTFAVFQDEYWDKSRAGERSQRPTRSVELLTVPGVGRYFYPVVALGAESPRLPLPHRYSLANVQGAQIERYSYTFAPAAEKHACQSKPAKYEATAGPMTTPGAGTGFIPSTKSRKPKAAKYAATPSTGSKPMFPEDAMPRTPEQPGEPTAVPTPPTSQGMFSDEQKQQIVAAVASIPILAKLTAVMPRLENLAEAWPSLQRMMGEGEQPAIPPMGSDINELPDEEDTEGEDAPGADVAAAPGEAGAGTPPGSAPPAVATPPAAGPDGEDDLADLIPPEPGEGPEGSHDEPDGDEDEEGVEPHKGANKPKPEAYAAGNEYAEKYSAAVQVMQGMKAVQLKQDEELAQLRGETESLRRTVRDNTRLSRIEKLSGTFGGLVDVQKYAAAWTGEKAIDDSAFEREIKMLEDMAAAKSLDGSNLARAVGDAPVTEAPPEKYSAAQKGVISERVMQLHSVYTSRPYWGKPVPQRTELKAEAIKQLVAEGKIPA